MNDLSNPKQQRIKRRHHEAIILFCWTWDVDVFKKASETWMRRTHTLHIIHHVLPLSVDGNVFFLFFFSVTSSFSHLERQNTFIKGAVCKSWLPAKSMLRNNKHKLAAQLVLSAIGLSSRLRKQLFDFGPGLVGNTRSCMHWPTRSKHILSCYFVGRSKFLKANLGFESSITIHRKHSKILLKKW